MAKANEIYDAGTIEKEITSGNKTQAAADLNYDYLHMSPVEFNALCKKLQGDAAASNSGLPPIDIVMDGDNIKSVELRDGFLNLYDSTTLFRKEDGDGVGALPDVFGTLLRRLLGAFQNGQ